MVLSRIQCPACAEETIHKLGVCVRCQNVTVSFAPKPPITEFNGTLMKGRTCRFTRAQREIIRMKHETHGMSITSLAKHYHVGEKTIRRALLTE